MHKISPSLATASMSISLASRMNLDITTGYSLDTELATLRYVCSSWLLWATFMAAPDSTYEGRTRTG
ncbi:hypothetical protein BpHYR1_033888 [Brachionus plicatilis]|uniref:Uncharacterized protein n=1 Tax=Brachionus plicatilis TaxID=10195 RepID=A0A3M7S641_BRAPC|nr:hypothetical protein BpHYR1_033888 [Brachionus plicatilis]